MTCLNMLLWLSHSTFALEPLLTCNCKFFLVHTSPILATLASPGLPSGREGTSWAHCAGICKGIHYKSIVQNSSTYSRTGISAFEILLPQLLYFTHKLSHPTTEWISLQNYQSLSKLYNNMPILWESFSISKEGTLGNGCIINISHAI